MIEEILEAFPEETFLKADGLDDAIIGVDTSSGDMRLIYSVKKCIEILHKNGGMEEFDAYEYFEFNTRGAFVGPQTPIWCDDDF